MNDVPYVIVALVALQRLWELSRAQANTKALLARGAVELSPRHYPLIVGLHALWLAAILWRMPASAAINWPLLAVFALLQGLRLWVLFSLGPYWTTRIITLPGAPLIKRGPYRFVRHPNYLVVAGEIAVLPLVFGEVWVAVIFSLANAVLLSWRIRQEENALEPRRAP